MTIITDTVSNNITSNGTKEHYLDAYNLLKNNNIWKMPPGECFLRFNELTVESEFRNDSLTV